ncbi:NAD(P)-binding domain-containing protein [Desulfovibrio litoralis]|uniref:4-hydroxybutyrate dehydrogenase / sulfolactaldehyde 3-reductase n=1 Tax=Desulfovibrio litoralis DSM 11393 TaxID=1121455 RepID=A0A1M7SPL1_9BACT|nr:NAD(P)-binding domain-containing protein [Desulfovibrio litoralis]SHN60392.1 4-hydroxybutyrate dehydrogenase / sulfolactaldehyde 3-reductase [Desulfovibrio litoralis DSM 11393]
MNVGFIGLGMMGEGMVSNLLKAGHTVKGYDISAAALERHAKAGGIATKSIQEVVKDVDVVMTMLPTGAHVESVLFGKDNAAALMKPGTIVIDSSTILPKTTESIASRLKEMGLAMLDAPVGRTSDHAWSGTLIFMVGGDAAHLEKARPLLEAMGEVVYHCGSNGAGIRSKIINNYMSIVLNVLTAEALTLGDKANLDRETLIKILMGTPAGRSHLATSYPAKVFKGDISPVFMLDLAAKDLGLAIQVGATDGVPLATGAAALQVYTTAQTHGRGREDWTAMLVHMHELAGLKK